MIRVLKFPYIKILPAVALFQNKGSDFGAPYKKILSSVAP